MPQPSIFEKSRPGHRGVVVPTPSQDFSLDNILSKTLQRDAAPQLPELSQLDTVRHFVALSQSNHAIDTAFYPLGSCTMKYNPKVCDVVGQLHGFTNLHPETPDTFAQGTLEQLYQLQEYLKDITGFSAVTLQPAAGAHGELVGIMMIKAYHTKRGETHRTEVLIPDSAHGTNPATAAMCGYDVIEVPCNEKGTVDVEALKSKLSPKTAGIMLTNPNTLGLFEADIAEITECVHNAGGLCYYDGANLNAIMGRTTVAKMGFDVMHMNTHKTFATPHGGGGPGSGPVAVNEKLEPFLPAPVLIKHHRTVHLDFDRPDSIGQVKLFWGNTEVLLRALAYIESYGMAGLKEVSETAVLNANYIKSQLQETYYVPYPGVCKHEFVMSSKWQKDANGDMNTLAIAKRLMDYGYHPPTVYFPLIVPEAMMIEPTETEAKDTLDAFIRAMKTIAEECRDNPELVVTAPHTTPIGRVDEVTANRSPNLAYGCACG
jgi:glycine dehydrogenase subunit 2